MTDSYDPIMHLSYLEALNSPDPSTQNGALLLRYDETLVPQAMEIIGRGHNHFPQGINKDFWYGEKQAKYDRVVHAEVAALLDAARKGNSTVNSVLVCGWAACANCAKHIADAGVRYLVRHSFEQNTETTGNVWYQDCLIGDEIMGEAGVKIIEIDPVAVMLRRNSQPWRP